MDPTPIDSLARTLYARRTLLGGLAGSGLAVLLGLVGPDRAGAHNYLARCRRIKNVARRRVCLKKARAHNVKHRRAPRQPNAACAVESNFFASVSGANRFAQTFTERNGGRLNAVQVIISRLPSTAGDYKLEVNTVDAGTGVPTNNSIAAAVLPASNVGTSPTLVTFRFEVPPLLVAGRQYALVHSRPGGSANHAVPVQAPGPCPGGSAFESDSLTGPFTPLSETDAFYATFVSS